MTVIDIQPDDTGGIPRAVGETTERLTLDDHPVIPRRPKTDPDAELPERAFALVDGHTNELPLYQPKVADPVAGGEGSAGADPELELAPFVRPTVQIPTLWERLFYTGRRRRQGWIASLFGGAR